MVTSTLTTPETEPTTDAPPTAQEVLDAARAQVRELEGALADLPTAYALAAKRGNASEMKRVRHARLDLEEELHAGRIAAAHAEIAALSAEHRDVCARDEGIAADVDATRVVLQAAHAAYEQARLANLTAESKISSQSWEKGELRAQSIAAEARLKALINEPMPD